MDEQLPLFEGFASGHVFSIGVFDTLLSTAYYSPDSLLLVQAMLSGGLAADTSSDFWGEQQVRHELDSGDVPRLETPRRNAYRVRQFSLLEPPLSNCVRAARGALSGVRLRHAGGMRGAEANADSKPTDWEAGLFTQSNYRELFLGALARFGIVCLGLYRQMDLTDASPYARRCAAPLSCTIRVVSSYTRTAVLTEIYSSCDVHGD